MTYAYDLQGRLIKDASKQISSITWTAFNKVETITRATGSTKPNLTFKYDAFGHRIYKKVEYGTIPLSGGAGVGSYEEWYILDASGTEITSYKKLSTETNAVPQQIHIFAASKLGYYRVASSPLLGGGAGGGVSTLNTSALFFEITDYQGSVRAVVTGTKDADGNAQIVSLTDYYAFGSVARKYQPIEAPQYGFHGMKRDNQVGNDDEDDYTTEFRQYDSDLGRWLTPDPLMAMYPDWSSYNFNFNNPINFTDVLGLGPEPKVGDTKGPYTYTESGWSTKEVIIKPTNPDATTVNESTSKPTVKPTPTPKVPNIKSGDLANNAKDKYKKAAEKFSIKPKKPTSLIPSDVTSKKDGRTANGFTDDEIDDINFILRSIDLSKEYLLPVPLRPSAQGNIDFDVNNQLIFTGLLTKGFSLALTLRSNVVKKLPETVFSTKAPTQVTPGITKLSGQYIDGLGRVQPWKASYDKFGRLIERTDWNAGNKVQGIEAIHHHLKIYLPKGQVKSIDHIPGVGPSTGW